MQKKTFSFLVVIFLCFFGILIITAGCGGSSGSGGGDETTDHNTMLKSLGVNTDIGERKNPAGDPVPADYNPTLRKVTQLAKRSEIFIAGIQGQTNPSWIPGSKHHAALDWADNATDFTAANLPGDDSWLTLPKAMASGDLDNDGQDEIIVAYLRTALQGNYDKELAFRVIKNSNAGYSIVAEDLIKSFSNDQITEYEPSKDPDYDYYYHYWWMANFNAVCGDVDGNGQSETLISFNGEVFLIGDMNKQYGLMKTISYPDLNSERYTLLKITAGDLDNDGMDEFVVVESNHPAFGKGGDSGTAFFHIYRGLTLDEMPDFGGQRSISATDEERTTVTLYAGNCAVGDLDADGLNEVLFIGPALGKSGYYILVLDQTWDETLGRFEFNFLPEFENILVTTIHRAPACAIADFDGDGKKEFIGASYMYENFSETAGTFQKKSTVENIYHPADNTGYWGNLFDSSLVVGDIDGDMKSDIAYISEDNESFSELSRLHCNGFNSSGEWVRKRADVISGTWGNYLGITMGDFDGDSITIEFIGSELLFSDPHPIAVLAANPSWKDLKMERGETAFGTSKSGSVQKEQKLGFSSGFSIGYEYEAPFINSGASIKASFENTFDWTAAESIEIKESHTYTTFDEDKVIFTTTPYDVFYYRVIKAPDGEMVDTVIAVNLPRKPITLAVERGFYNAHNGESPDIDGTVLAHTIGDPFSYPTSAGADRLISNGGGQGVKSSDTETMGQGQTTTEIEMSIENTKAKGKAFDFEVKIEASAKVLGLTTGRSVGFHYGESYKLSTTEGTLYRGKVGGVLQGEFNSDRFFTWGLFSYQAVLDNEKFIVVDYYTSKVVQSGL